MDSKTTNANLLWLCEPDFPDARSLFEAFADAGISILPVLCDKHNSTAANLQQAKDALQTIQENEKLAQHPIGIAGIGYGGFIAGHLLAESDAFAAGAIISGLTNPATAYGTCKGITLPSNQLADGFSLQDYLKKLTKDSVAYRCDTIHTPLLLLHGFRDEVYGFEQAEQLFTPIKERHPEAEIRMVVFPEGGHHLAEDPACAKEYEKELITWFTEKLKGELHHDA